MLNKKETYILIVIIVILIAGFLFLGAYLKKTSLNGDSPNLLALPINAITAFDWIKGDKNAKTILIEYSDFQCPACAAYYPLVKKITEELGDNMTFIYRHFPLSQHLNAKLSATASEAAGKQNKFWEMHDLIFENQKDWSNLSNSKAKELLTQYAKTLNLDIKQFKNDLGSDEIKNKIGGDLKSGSIAKVNSTPTFFLNGKKISPKSYEEFKQMVIFQIEISNAQSK